MDLILDNTKRSTFVSCPRKYYFSFIRNLESDYGSSAIRYGVAFHAGMEVLYQHIKVKGFTGTAMTEGIQNAIKEMKKIWEEESKDRFFYEDYRTFENLCHAFAQYNIHFQNDKNFLEVLETERTVRAEVDMSDYNLPNFTFAGKIDAEVSLSGQRWNLDYKTTGQSLALQTKRIARSPQFMGYQWLANQEGHTVEGNLVCFHRIYAGKLKKGGYGKLSCEFQRDPFIFQDADIENWLSSMKYTASLIIQQLEKRQWPQFFDSCFQYGQCTYYTLCSQLRPLGEERTDGYHTRTPWDKELQK